MINKVSPCDLNCFIDEYVKTRNSLVHANRSFRKVSKISQEIIQQWEKTDALVSRLSGRLAKYILKSSDNKCLVVAADHPIFKNYFFNRIQESKYKESCTREILISDLSYKSTNWLISFYEGKPIEEISWKSLFELAYFADKSLEPSLTLQLHKIFFIKLKRNEGKSIFESCPRRAAWFLENLHQNIIGFLEEKPLTIPEFELLVDVLNKNLPDRWEEKIKIPEFPISNDLANNLLLLKLFKKKVSVSLEYLINRLPRIEAAKVLESGYNCILSLINKNAEKTLLNSLEFSAVHNVLGLFTQEKGWMKNLSLKGNSVFAQITIDPATGLFSKESTMTASLTWYQKDGIVKVVIEYPTQFQGTESQKSFRTRIKTEQIIRELTILIMKKFKEEGKLSPFQSAILFINGVKNC